MKKLITVLLISAFSLLTLSACTASEKISDMLGTVLIEANEGYENVKTEVEEKTSAVSEKIEKINQAAEDVSEAASAIGTAIDSVQSINEEVTE